MGGAPPSEISGSLPSNACCECRHMSACKTQQCTFRKAGLQYTNLWCQGCSNILFTLLEVQYKTTDGGWRKAARRGDLTTAAYRAASPLSEAAREKLR